MIKANMDKVELEGEPADIVFEMAAIITTGVAQVAKESGYDPQEILGDIMIGYQYNTLVQSGMTPEEAWEIAGPKEDENKS